MPGWTELRRGLLLLVGAALLLPASASQAEPKAKSTQSEAVWVNFDSEKNIVTAKIRKPGKGAKPPRELAVKKGRKADFNVKPTGSVLTRTTVAINGQKGELTDIPAGKTVNIYWVPDPKDETARFARKIDVIFSDEELDARYEVVE